MQVKTRLAIWIILPLFALLAGCSHFVLPPRTAHIQIRGPGNHAKEFTFSLDAPIEKDMDIPLSAHYAVELYLQWLWYEKDDLKFRELDDSKLPTSPLTPWVICKYRF